MLILADFVCTVHVATSTVVDFFLFIPFFLFLSSSQIALNSETLAAVLNDTATLIRDPHSLSALDVVYVTNIIQLSLDRTTVSAEVKTIFQSFEAIMQLRAWSSPILHAPLVASSDALLSELLSTEILLSMLIDSFVETVILCQQHFHGSCANNCS